MLKTRQIWQGKKQEIGVIERMHRGVREEIVVVGETGVEINF